MASELVQQTQNQLKTQVKRLLTAGIYGTCFTLANPNCQELVTTLCHNNRCSPKTFSAPKLNPFAPESIRKIDDCWCHLIHTSSSLAFLAKHLPLAGLFPSKSGLEKPKSP